MTQKAKTTQLFECLKSEQNCSDFGHFLMSEIRTAICPVVLKSERSDFSALLNI